MVEGDVAELLRKHDIRPSAQRVAIAKYVLATDTHPTAEEVLQMVRRRFPFVSRATVYNTLNLLVDKGLLRQLALAGGGVFDAHTDRHHHFVDEDSGELQDIPWDALKVTGLDALGEVEISDYMIMIRGRKKKRSV